MQDGNATIPKAATVTSAADRPREGRSNSRRGCLNNQEEGVTLTARLTHSDISLSEVPVGETYTIKSS